MLLLLLLLLAMLVVVPLLFSLPWALPLALEAGAAAALAVASLAAELALLEVAVALLLLRRLLVLLTTLRGLRPVTAASSRQTCRVVSCHVVGLIPCCYCTSEIISFYSSISTMRQTTRIDTSTDAGAKKSTLTASLAAKSTQR